MPDTVTPIDQLTIDRPEFVGAKLGFNGGVKLANLRILEFSAVLAELDPDGRLREEIREALNDRPGLAARIVHAAFTHGPRSP